MSPELFNRRAAFAATLRCLAAAAVVGAGFFAQSRTVHAGDVLGPDNIVEQPRLGEAVQRQPLPISKIYALLSDPTDHGWCNDVWSHGGCGAGGVGFVNYPYVSCTTNALSTGSTVSWSCQDEAVFNMVTLKDGYSTECTGGPSLFTNTSTCSISHNGQQVSAYAWGAHNVEWLRDDSEGAQASPSADQAAPESQR